MVLLGLPMLPRAQESGAFSVKYYCTSWGRTESWDAFCEKVKKAGFDGVETVLPASADEQKQMADALRRHGLSLAVLCYAWGSDAAEHLDMYRQKVEEAVRFRPDFINTQTGKDHYTFGQNRAFFDLADRISRDSGIPVYHETHRGRFSFAAHVTRDYLERIPSLMLTLDISHWCCVHESMLQDQQEAVALALERTAHVHARVGHPEGPQVSDPAAPEWKRALDRHLEWWDGVVARRREQGHGSLTITAEFGPAGYLPTLPHSGLPVGDQWAANLFIFKLLKARYAQ